MYYFREVLEEKYIMSEQNIMFDTGHKIQLGVRITEPLEIQTPKGEISLKKKQIGS